MMWNAERSILLSGFGGAAAVGLFAVMMSAGNAMASDRYGEITSPGAGETVGGEVTFSAFLVDDDQDAVQWAVRQGTCAANTNTVFGNVDGHNDPFTWTYEGGLHTFSAVADTSSWAAADFYCFILNPVEDSGEANIRLTVEFVVTWDMDSDGVLDVDDNCPFDFNADQADFDGDGDGDVCDDDVDGDGVGNDGDFCAGTLLGSFVDAAGCSIDQYCPCEADWKNHGDYTSCVSHASNDFFAAGIITEHDKDDIQGAAGSSSCGHKENKGKGK